jgi:multidrug transporter EmrE-like cation transporter
LPGRKAVAVVAALAGDMLFRERLGRMQLIGVATMPASVAVLGAVRA